MAKAKSQAEKVAAAAVAAALNSDQVELVDEETEGAVADALAAIADFEGSEQALFHVSCIRKFPPDPDALGKIESIDRTNLNFDYFRSRYGPGEYKVMGYLNNRFVRGTHAKIKISNIGNTPVTAKADSTDAGDLITRLEAQRLAREESERKARSERMKDWAAIAGSLGVGSIIAAVIARKPAYDPLALVAAMKGPNLTELATVMQTLRAQQESQPSGQIESVLKVLDMVQSKLGPGAGESGWIDVARDVIREVIPAARPILENLVQQQQVNRQTNNQPIVVQATSVPSQPSLAAPSPVVTQATTGSPGNNSNGSSAPPAGDDMLSMIKPFLMRKCEDLLEWAQENRNIELCAEWLLESIPKLYRAQVSAEQLKAWVTRADWWPILAQFYPQLQPYQIWVDDLRRQVLALLEEEIAEATAQAPEVNNEEVPHVRN